MTNLPQKIQTVKDSKPVIYDRSARQYNVVDLSTGEIVETFPCGRDGKRAAFQLGVKLQNESLYHIAVNWNQQYPQLTSRVWRAVEIILSNGVLPPFSMQYVAVVTSQNSAYGEYNIAMHDKMLQCDCEDFVSFSAPMIGENTQPLCKHLLAYIMFAQLNTNTVM